MVEQVEKIERRAKALDRTMAYVLRAAGVAGSTWQRWKSGKGGRVHTLDKIESALDKMEV